MANRTDHYAIMKTLTTRSGRRIRAAVALALVGGGLTTVGCARHDAETKIRPVISQQNSPPPAVPRTIYIPPKPETLQPVAPAVATPTAVPLVPPAGPNEAGQVAVDLTSPRAAMLTYYQAIAAGDAEAAKQAVTGDEMATRYLEAVATYAGGLKDLEAALSSKFGQDAVSGNEAFVKTVARYRPTLAVEAITAAEVRMSGDIAIVTPKLRSGAMVPDATGPSPVHPMPGVLRQMDGKWRLLIGAMRRQMYGRQVAQADAAIDTTLKSGQSMHELAKEVRGGRYLSADEVWTTGATNHQLALGGKPGKAPVARTTGQQTPAPGNTVRPPTPVQQGTTVALAPKMSAEPKVTEPKAAEPKIGEPKVVEQPGTTSQQPKVIEASVGPSNATTSGQSGAPVTPPSVSVGPSDVNPPTATTTRPSLPMEVAVNPPAAEVLPPEIVKPATPSGVTPAPVGPTSPAPKVETPGVSITLPPTVPNGVTPAPEVSPKEATPGAVASAADDLSPDAALVEAINRGRLEIQKAELDSKNGDVNAKDPLGRAAIHRAAIGGELELAKLLIDRNADVQLRDAQGWTALHWASSGGHVEVVKLLIDKGARVDAKGESEDTPLHWAAVFDRPDIANMLIAAGADVNARDARGKTPLHAAVEREAKTVVSALLNKKADVNAKDNDGFTALHLCILHARKSLSELAIADAIATAEKYGDSKYTRAQIVMRAVSVADVLLANKADVNARTARGATALHLAAWDATKPLAEKLIAKGADLSAVDARGKTPMQAASDSKQRDAVAALASAGAKE